MIKHRKKTEYTRTIQSCCSRRFSRKRLTFAGAGVRFLFCSILILTLLLPCMTVGFSDGETGASAAEQRQFVDPVSYPDRYSAVLYNNTNGMPTSEANAIAETSDGFIWIGSGSAVTAGLYAMTDAASSTLTLPRE